MILAFAFLFAATGSGWSDARAIVVPPLQRPAYVRLPLPQGIDPGPDGSYTDLRVADGSDAPVPYALDADRHDTPGAAVSLSDAGFVPGRFTQAIADLGTSRELHSSIRLETTHVRSFFEHVEIATSDDRRTWSVAVPDALIYRVDGNEYNGRTTIDFGPSRARWVRIRVLDGVHEFPITSVDLPSVEPVSELVALAGVQTIKQLRGTTVVTIDFGSPHQNLDAVAFTAATREFSRNVVLEVSEGGASSWQEVASTDITRYAGARYAWLNSVTIATAYRYTRYLRATIQNRADPPLAGLQVIPLGFEHHVVFQAVPGGSYRLLWGNDHAGQPVYDLGERLRHESWTAQAVATLGGAASTTFADPLLRVTPWLATAALTISLSLLFIVVLAVALIAMKKPAT